MARTGIPRIYLSMPDVTKPSPDRPWHLQAAAGVQFGLLTPLGGEAMIWVPQWAPAAGGGWAVTYQGRRTSVHPDVRDLRAPGEALVARLVRAAEFAERLSLPAWEETFTRVLTLAVAPRPVPPYYPDMLPSGCAEPVRVLVSMATAAYVFGGEGSWNDLGFEDPAVAREHQSISAELFAATMGAFTAAVNA
ncbi:MAG: hypothetical protein QOJ50_2759 [Cryptosporangiaceae bacterium]|nr:hypothetical protein [Cryptosporangiaceae bacterium]